MANVETAAGHPGDETSVLEFSLRVPLPGIYLVLLGGLLLRLVLATLSGFDTDISLFRFWSERLAADGPWDFYNTDFFTDYAPGYMYVLLLIGELDQIFSFGDGTFEYVLKLPAVAADVGSAYLLYKLLEGQRKEVRLGAAALWLVFPATLLIGPIWGQVDSLLSFFLLLCIYYISKDRPVRGAVAFTLGFLMKPQAIAALPFLAVWIMRRHPPAWLKGEAGPLVPQLWVRITGICLGVVFVLILPFFTYQPWELITQLYNATDVENYRVNSFWAYNFWTVPGLFEGGFQPDDETFLGVTHRVWGILMFLGAIAAIIGVTWRARGAGMLALGVALSVFAFYLFLTRMHERYLFPAMLPMLAAAVLLSGPAAKERLDEIGRWVSSRMEVVAGAALCAGGLLILGLAVDIVFVYALLILSPLLLLTLMFTRTMVWFTFLAVSTIHFLNLYHVFTYDLYNQEGPNQLKIERLQAWLGSGDFLGTGYESIQVFSFLMVILFFVGLGAAARISNRPETVQTRAT